MLYLSNSTGQFTHEIFTDRLRGNHVRRIITLADELDPPHGAGGANCFPVESWVIDRIAQLDNAVMRLELTAEASFEGVQFPQRVMLRDLCQHSYRRWRPALHDFDYTNVTCPYTNRVYFTNNGTRTTDPSQDACSFHLGTGCRKRFGGDLPFLGFPGVRRL
jgi:lambda family phage minor tail protein L